MHRYEARTQLIRYKKKTLREVAYNTIDRVSRVSKMLHRIEFITSLESEYTNSYCDVSLCMKTMAFAIISHTHKIYPYLLS